MNTGVYCILNKNTGKRYVGSAAQTFMHRWRSHKSRLSRNCHHICKLQRSWNKHGPEAFEFIILERCEPENAVSREQYWLEHFDSANHGYNINPVAGSRLNATTSEETKRKIGAKSLGRKHTLEHRERMSAMNRGKVLSPEHRAKISAAHKGKKLTAEHIERVAAKKRGVPQSLEHRQKISKANKGKVVSAETKAKLSANKTAYYRSRKTYRQKQFSFD